MQYVREYARPRTLGQYFVVQEGGKRPAMLVTDLRCVAVLSANGKRPRLPGEGPAADAHRQLLQAVTSGQHRRLSLTGERSQCKMINVYRKQGETSQAGLDNANAAVEPKQCHCLVFLGSSIDAKPSHIFSPCHKMPKSEVREVRHPCAEHWTRWLLTDSSIGSGQV